MSTMCEHCALCVEDFNSHHSQPSSVKDNVKSIVVWARNNESFSLPLMQKMLAMFIQLVGAVVTRQSPDLCFSSCERSFKPEAIKRLFLCAFLFSTPCFVSTRTYTPLVWSISRSICEYDADTVPAMFSRLGMVLTRLFLNILFSPRIV